MSPALKSFFTHVTADKDLQQKLYMTKELADVAIIGQKLGFKITGAQMLRAQAGRIVTLPLDQIEEIAEGKKPKMGAQWGREGHGYLDSAGYWLCLFIEWDFMEPAHDKALESFFAHIYQVKLLRAKLILAKTYNDVARIAHAYGYIFSGSSLLQYIAQQVVRLNDEYAEQVSQGACSF